MDDEQGFSGWPGTNWVADSSLPGGRPGTAAFGEDIQGGDCGGGAGDVSGVMRLESPSIRLPSGVVHSYRLGFTHYIASELGWDGGNVKLSVNGGAYAVVPAGAFFFNPYNATLQTQAAGNTNPLAGQPAFTGTDGGKVVGSWGTSYVDLSILGVKPGDTIRLRFDFGMDGCTGIDGWYVDDVTSARATPTRRRRDGSLLERRPGARGPRRSRVGHGRKKRGAPASRRRPSASRALPS